MAGLSFWYQVQWLAVTDVNSQLPNFFLSEVSFNIFKLSVRATGTDC